MLAEATFSRSRQLIVAMSLAAIAAIAVYDCFSQSLASSLLDRLFPAAVGGICLFGLKREIVNIRHGAHVRLLSDRLEIFENNSHTTIPLGNVAEVRRRRFKWAEDLFVYYVRTSDGDQHRIPHPDGIDSVMSRLADMRKLAIG